MSVKSQVSKAGRYLINLVYYRGDRNVFASQSHLLYAAYEHCHKPLFIHAATLSPKTAHMNVPACCDPSFACGYDASITKDMRGPSVGSIGSGVLRCCRQQHIHVVRLADWPSLGWGRDLLTNFVAVLANHPTSGMAQTSPLIYSASTGL